MTSQINDLQGRKLCRFSARVHFLLAVNLSVQRFGKKRKKKERSDSILLLQLDSIFWIRPQSVSKWEKESCQRTAVTGTKI
jgi:hypothetical protein